MRIRGYRRRALSNAMLATGIVVFVSGPIVILRAIRVADMRLAFGAWGSYMPAGTAVMVLATPAMLSAIGWRGIWMVNAGLLAAYLVIYWVGTRSVPDASDEADRRMAERARAVGRNIRAVLGSKGSWLLALVFATYASGYVCTTAFLPTYLIEEHGVGHGWAATATAIAIGSNVVGNLTGGWLMHCGARRWVLIVTALAIMATTSMLAFQPFVGAIGACVLAVVFSMCGGILPASVLGGVPQHVPQPSQVGAGNGLVMQWANIGQFATPPLFAAIAVSIGWSSAPWLVVALSGFGILFAFGIRRIEAG